MSGYFYRRARVARQPVFQKVVALSLADYLAGWPYDDPDMGPPMSNFLPPVTHPDAMIEEFERTCVAVGTVEQMARSLEVFAIRLGLPVPKATPPWLNAAARDQLVPLELKEEFLSRNRLEVAIYDWAKARLAEAL